MSLDLGIHADTWIMRSPTVLWRQTGAEVIATTQGRDDFDKLSPTAAAVWLLLDAPITLGQLKELVAERYGKPAESIASDVEALVGDLLARGLVEAIADADD